MTSILKCTLKKSLEVTKKLVLYASYVIVGIAGVFFAIYGTMGLLEWSLTVFMIPASWIIGGSLGILISLPWYVYAGLLVVVGIVGYSFAWCVKRELTEEDYKESKDDIVGSIYVGSTCFLIEIIIMAMSYYQPEKVVMFIIGSLFVIVLLAVGLVRATPVINAYLRHRKRVRGEV